MSGFFNPENRLFSTMSKVFDIIVLNLIWLALYIPFFSLVWVWWAVVKQDWFFIPVALSLIVFIPSFTALYYAIVKSVRRQRGYAYKEFFRSFKLNFKQGAIFSLIYIALGLILYYDFTFASNGLKAEPNNVYFMVMFCVFVIVAFILITALMYIPAVISRFTMKSKNLFKFCFGISAKHFWCTILSLLVWVAVAFLVWFSGGMFLLFGASIGVLVQSLFMEKVLKKYVVQVIDREKQNREGEESGAENSGDTEKENDQPKKDEWYIE